MKMQPHTVHRIAQEVRYLRGLLTAENKWAQNHLPDTQERIDVFLRIHFWRDVLAQAEVKIASGYDVSIDHDGELVKGF